MNERQRRFLDVLRRTATMPPARMQDYQRGLLEAVVRHAATKVPFYRDRLRSVLSSDGSFDFGGWADVPVFGRAAAQAGGAELYATTLPEDNERWVEGQTSGSTGIPFRHRRSNFADLASRCLTERDYEWYGVDVEQALADIHETWDGKAAFPDGFGGGRWNLRGNGEFIVLDVRTTVEQQIDWLRRKRPRYLMTYPSLLRALAEHAIESGVVLSFDTVLTIGETLSADVRAKCQNAFGARVLDRYGAQEIGHIASECPACSQYHVSAESVIVEILREDGAPAKRGEIGRVIVTSFYNYAMPFIRYEIGDYAEVGWHGICVRTLPTLQRIVGRERNIFILPDGARVWPDTRTIDMQRFIGFRQVQVVQKTDSDIEVRYVPDASGRPPDETGLQRYFRAVLHHALNVRAIAVEEIARLPSHKFEDYVSLVGRDAAQP